MADDRRGSDAQSGIAAYRAAGNPKARAKRFAHGPLFALAKRTVKRDGNDLSRGAGHTFACPVVLSVLEERAVKIETPRSQIVVPIDRGQRAAAGRMFKRVRHQRNREAERLHRRFELARHSAVVGGCARAGRQRSDELLRAARDASEREARIR